MIDSAVTDLPLPDSPTRPECFTGANLEAHIVYGGDRARRQLEDSRSDDRRPKGRRCHLNLVSFGSWQWGDWRPSRRAPTPHHVFVSWYSPKTVRMVSGISPTSGLRFDSRDNWRHEVFSLRAAATRHRWPLASLRRFGLNEEFVTRSICCRSTSGSTRNKGNCRWFLWLFGTRNAQSIDADDHGFLRTRSRPGPDMRIPESRAGSSLIRLPSRCRQDDRLDPRSSSASRSIWLVKDSMAKDPATGSTVLATPLSAAMICCVRSGQTRRFFGRQRKRFVPAVAVQGLRSAEHCGQRLKRDANDIVVRLLSGQRAAGRLRVEIAAAALADGWRGSDRA